MYCLLREDLSLSSRLFIYQHPASQQTWHGQRAYRIFHQASVQVLLGGLQAVHRLSVIHLWGLNPEGGLKNRYRYIIYVLIKSFNLIHIVCLRFGFGCLLTELVVGLPRATPLWLIGHPGTKLHMSVDSLTMRISWFKKMRMSYLTVPLDYSEYI